MSDIIDALTHISNNNIEGCLVECGVQYGRKTMEMANTILKLEMEPRDIYMYDTFSGLTEPSSKYDWCLENQEWKEHSDVVSYWRNQSVNNILNRWCYASIETVKNNMESIKNYPKERYHYIMGNILETLKEPKNIPDKISLLRLDTDWYDSTKMELEILYPKLVIGGILIIDDYYYWNGSRQATDEYFNKNKNIKLEKRYDVAYGIKY